MTQRSFPLDNHNPRALWRSKHHTRRDQMSMPTKVEDDVAGHAFLFRLNGFVDYCADGVSSLRCRNNPFSPRKLYGSVEDCVLPKRDGFDDAHIMELTNKWCSPVIAQTSRMDTGWHEIMSIGIRNAGYIFLFCFYPINSRTFIPMSGLRINDSPTRIALTFASPSLTTSSRV